MPGIDQIYSTHSLPGVHCTQVRIVVQLGLAIDLFGAQNLNEGPSILLVLVYFRYLKYMGITKYKTCLYIRYHTYIGLTKHKTCLYIRYEKIHGYNKT